jgi:antitoxin component HigA of HigAB toxin-antitoxin module
MSMPKNVEWLRSCMGQYRSTMNDIDEAIGEIGLECTSYLAAKGA